ncbi:MAG: hypothetical protein KKA79_05080 [Nanoarchaeota archaeon]|nr:hypothetical protein [Nanoarchaeota archaeon]MCG2718876.1 hypothetical protein [Nanoarchaeota archaeon]
MKNLFNKILKPKKKALSEKELKKLSEEDLLKYINQHPKLLGKVGYLSSVFDKIVKLKKTKKYDKMLILLDNALKKYPNNLDLAMGKAWALSMMERDEECINFCEKQLKKYKKK